MIARFLRHSMLMVVRVLAAVFGWSGRGSPVVDSQLAVGPTDWQAILDDQVDPKQCPPIDEIEKMMAMEELKECSFLCDVTPMTQFQRQITREAIDARCRMLGINPWDWTLNDGGTRLQMAAGMTDAMVIIGGPVTILDDVLGKPLKIRFKGSQANAVTGNLMLYRKPILDEAVVEVHGRAKSRRITPGEEGHPAQFQGLDGLVRFKVTPANQIIMPFNVVMDEQGQVIVDAEVIETTEPGRRLAADVRAGRPVYFSTRALGAEWTKAVLDGREIRLPGKMVIDTWDRVGNPAVNDATIIAVLDEAQVASLIQPNPVATKKEEGSNMLTKEQIAQLKLTVEGRQVLRNAVGAADEATKSLILDALAEAPPAPPAVMDAAQIKTIVDQAIADAGKVATEAATAQQAKKAEAWTYVQDEAKKLDRFDEHTRNAILDELKDCPDKTTAEILLRQQVRIADNMLASLAAQGLGFGGVPGNPVLHMNINEKAPWQEICDKLIGAFDDWRWQATGERPDPGVRKVNKPMVDKMMRIFDARNVLALTDSAKSWNTVTDAISSSDLYNAAVVQRAILEQAFGDADMLQFLGTDVFEGQTWQIPVEYFSAPRSPELDTGENASIAEASIRTAFLNFSPTPRRVRIEISNDAQFRMMGGALKYNATARALYHIAALMRRVLNKAAGNEMLRSADAYGAVTKAGEVCVVTQVTAVVDATNVAWKIQPANSGTTGAPVANIPLVRPRIFTKVDSSGLESQGIENQIKVVVSAVDLVQGYLDADGNIVNAAGDVTNNLFAVDYETGLIYVSDGSTIVTGGTPVLPTITYSYATNYVNFSLTVPGGIEPADYYTRLIQQIDLQSALMAKKPRYMKPNMVLGSLTAMTYPKLASIFYQLQSPKGTVLSPETGNYIASRGGVDYAQHNTDWQAGDSRILLGRMGATKYGVRDPFRLEGPAHSYDANRKVIGAKQYYAEEFSALVTPEVKDQAGVTLNPTYRTIRLT